MWEIVASEPKKHIFELVYLICNLTETSKILTIKKMLNICPDNRSTAKLDKSPCSHKKKQALLSQDSKKVCSSSRHEQNDNNYMAVLGLRTISKTKKYILMIDFQPTDNNLKFNIESVFWSDSKNTDILMLVTTPPRIHPSISTVELFGEDDGEHQCHSLGCRSDSFHPLLLCFIGLTLKHPKHKVHLMNRQHELPYVVFSRLKSEL